MMKWAKGLHERNKELGEIDKEIRATLKDSLIARKELHEIEQKKLETELANLADKMKKHADALHTEKEISEGAINTIDVICRLASLIQSSSNVSDKIQEHYLRLIEILISSRVITRDKLSEMLKNGTGEKKPFSSAEEEIIWRLTEMFDEPVRTQILANTIVRITPIAFDYFLQNPMASQQEKQKFISDFLKQRANEIRSKTA
ncbi:MAG: hypothetical protein A3G79_02830 [Gallionellales bacterium RIFCSPLOWO2_12_FULL_57_18]|nr:MAG: hypothetical protein A3G79_02830 [Gallionellales bacterium RIFCSPLOWO2_12_FULL_57_18]